MRASALVPLLLAIGCTPDFSEGRNAPDGVVDDDTVGGDTSDGEDEVDPADFDGATLAIVSPADGAFLPLGETVTFAAELLDADGAPMDYADITWTTSIDADWSAVGAVADLDDLPIGQNTFRATAILPNGDQVTDAVGGVLVQPEDAGVYAGNMILDATGEYEGTPITTSCVGGAVITIDAWGETATGSSTCVLSLLGFNQEATHVFDLDLSEGDLTGSASIDLGFVGVDFDAEGAVSDGSLEAEWADNLYGFVELDGTLEVERVTRSVTGE
jgi:hypothetical protein